MFVEKLNLKNLEAKYGSACALGSALWNISVKITLKSLVQMPQRPIFHFLHKQLIHLQEQEQGMSIDQQTETLQIHDLYYPKADICQ